MLCVTDVGRQRKHEAPGIIVGDCGGRGDREGRGNVGGNSNLPHPPMPAPRLTGCGTPGIATPPILPGTIPGLSACSNIDLLIILNLTVGANGRPVGDYLNEFLLKCSTTGCVGRFWNTYTRSWQSSPARRLEPWEQALVSAGQTASPAQYLVVGMFPPAIEAVPGIIATGTTIYSEGLLASAPYWQYVAPFLFRYNPASLPGTLDVWSKRGCRSFGIGC